MSKKINKRLTGLLPKETQAEGFKVVGLEEHDTFKKGIIEGKNVDFEKLTVGRANRFMKNNVKFLVKNNDLVSPNQNETVDKEEVVPVSPNQNETVTVATKSSTKKVKKQ